MPKVGDFIQYVSEGNGETYPAIITSVGPNKSNGSDGISIGVAVFVADATFKNGKAYGSNPPPAPPGGPGGR